MGSNPKVPHPVEAAVQDLHKSAIGIERPFFEVTHYDMTPLSEMSATHVKVAVDAINTVRDKIIADRERMKNALQMQARLETQLIHSVMDRAVIEPNWTWTLARIFPRPKIMVQHIFMVMIFVIAFVQGMEWMDLRLWH